jgi:hypothetical protein
MENKNVFASEFYILENNFNKYKFKTILKHKIISLF